MIAAAVVPVGAQYIAAFSPAVPAELRHLPPTARRHRAALRSAAHAAGWTLVPSRRELAHGAAYLAVLASGQS